MEIITLPELRFGDLQSFSESLLPIVEPLPQLAPQVQTFKDAFAVFKDGMTKKQASSDKKTLDKARDQLIAGLMYGVLSEQSFLYKEQNIIDALKEIVDITDKYGFELSRLPYNRQSAKTDNMLKELERASLSLFPSLERWIAPIKLANEDFKKEADEYVGDQSEASDTVAAYLAVPDLENAIKALFILLFSHRQVADTKELKAAYKKILALVASYR